MLENAVARRYAQAFFTIAKEQKLIDKLENELKDVIEIIDGNIELKRVMDHQLVSPEEKKAILNQVVSGEISEITVNFLNVVIEKYRATYIPAIYDEFVKYANESRNMVDAEVQAAVALSDPVVENIRSKLAALTGKTVRLQTKTDPGLIGGVTVRIGDQVIDGSLATRLARLKENLLRIEVKEIGVSS